MVDEATKKKLLAAMEGLDVKALGRYSGAVAVATAKTDTAEHASCLKQVLALLSAGFLAAGILVLRSCIAGSGSQILGITHAEPGGEIAGTTAGQAVLFGYCLEKKRKRPKKEEPFEALELDAHDEYLPVAGVLHSVEDILPDFIEKYKVLEELDRQIFTDRFRQTSVWFTTDDIGFSDVSKRLFAPFHFFGPDAFEIVCWLAESVRGINGRWSKSRLRKELLEVWVVNRDMGMFTLPQQEHILELFPWLKEAE